MSKVVNITSDKPKRRKPNFFIVFLLALVLGFVAFFITTGGNTNTFSTSIAQFAAPYISYNVKFEAGANDSVTSSIKSTLGTMKLGGINRFNFTDSATSIISRHYLNQDPLIDKNDLAQRSLSNQYIVPVGHVYWLRDDVKKSEIANLKIYVPSSDLEWMTRVLKEYLGSDSIKVYGSADLLGTLQKESSSIIGFIDAQSLDARYKLLTLDGKYFLDDPVGGISYGYMFDNSIPTHIARSAYEISDLNIDYKKDDILTVRMTGVTAISRNLAVKTNASGQFDYAAQKIYKFLAQADLTHTSNEVSFAPGCVPTQAMRFCADSRYIEALKKSGMDIIELTGNHNNDYGASNNTATIKTYKSLGWDYFGGGLNDTDASKILVKEIKGSKVAFLGYNYYDTVLHTGAIASDSHAGANYFSFDKMKKNIAEAKKLADIVIVDFQFQECYSYPESGGIYPICYKPLAAPDQKGTFRAAIDYGADIVIGTQAHQPQTYEVYKNKLIFYGLGNLFFDQTPWIGTRQGVILTHYIYKGRLLQTKLTTTYYDNDMRTYVSTGSQRTLLLQLLKEAR